MYVVIRFEHEEWKKEVKGLYDIRLCGWESINIWMVTAMKWKKREASGVWDGKLGLHMRRIRVISFI